MRILLLCRSLGIGGTERQVVTLAEGLQARGVDFAVMLFYGQGVLEKELRRRGIAILDLGKSGRWDALGFFLRMIRGVRAFEPAVIYGFLGTPNIFAVLLRPFVRGAKVVWGIRASNVNLDHYDWLTRLIYRIERRLASRADLIICNSRAGLANAAAQGFPTDKMITIPNGINTGRFKPDLAERSRVRAEWRVGDGDVLIGIVSRLDPMKDHATWLRAAAMLAQESAEVRFACIGDGPGEYRERLQRLSRELGLDGRMIWAGARTDMPGVFNALDIAVSSSEGEGFSNTLTEAMACGVPCVATDVGDSAWIVGETGVVVQPGVPAALCEGLRQAIGKLSPELRRAARSSIVSRFDSDSLVDQTMIALLRL